MGCTGATQRGQHGAPGGEGPFSRLLDEKPEIIRQYVIPGMPLEDVYSLGSTSVALNQVVEDALDARVRCRRVPINQFSKPLPVTRTDLFQGSSGQPLRLLLEHRSPPSAKARGA